MDIDSSSAIPRDDTLGGHPGNAANAASPDSAANAALLDAAANAASPDASAADAACPRPSGPELLAPAGDMASFQAALLAGADAIYLGLGDFNARRNAENLTLDDLSAACRMAHLAGRRVYLTLNILIGPGEMDQAVALARDAWERGIDAAIVQDLGLVERLHREVPALELHTSTQMNLMTKAGIALARKMGASRVTLARELSLGELEELAREGMELEVFAHGALCVCYSGQCLMSSLIGRRSANRGLCAQPCRLPWDLVGEDGQAVETPGPHLLSPKDLCTIDILPRLIATGVRSLKIEGRMKSPAYVSAVVGVYRACIDRAMESPDSYHVTDDEHNRLAEAFSRGFSTAYLEHERGNAMMSYQRPNNRGVPVGRVSRVGGGRVDVALSRPAMPGDVLEFWTGRGRVAVEVAEVDAAGLRAGSHGFADAISLEVRGAVAPGDRVFRVRSAMLEQAGSDATGGQGVPCELSMHVEARLGQPLSITVSDALGRQGSASGAVCEAARSKAISAAEIREQAGRLGGTPYSIGRFEVELDEGVGMGFSQIHRTRRAAIESYEAAVLQPWSQRHASGTSAARADSAVGAVEAATGMEAAGGPTVAARQPRAAEAAAFVGTPEAAAACRDAGASVIYVPAEDLLASLEHEGADAWGVPGKMVPVLPTVIHDGERGMWEDMLARGGFSAVACDDAATAAWLSGRFDVEAGPRTNVLNSDTARVLAGIGAKRMWLTPELSLGQIADVLSGTALPATITVNGRQELMITEHCELMAMGPCAQHCATCPRRARQHMLRDRKGYCFPVLTDAQGRGHVFNSVELDIVPQIPELANCGIGRFVVDARLMDAQRARYLVKRATQAVEACNSGMAGLVGGPLVKLPDTTTGHLFRGVL